jgi:benzylsuccinate CoA-transferase BbsF subunit
MPAPLDGIHVLDLSWVMVGPVSGRYLADLGADVVKVESSRRIDPVRTLGPFKDGRSGPERSVSYHNLNAGKRCITLDIRKPAGRDLVMRLAEWADIAIESFTPGVLDELQLGYRELSARNPRLIMASTSILGQTGPDAKGTSGVGTMGAAMSGATHQFGWPDRAPCGPFGPWTDGVAPRFIVSSILAALHRRTLTGEGCYIDVAQSETGVQFMMPAYYEYAANGKLPQRRGVAGSPMRAPEGVYRCAGEDRWVAISASDSPHWMALRSVIGGALLDRRFDTMLRRLRNRAAIDAAISAWTSDKDSDSVEAMLQAARVAAHIVSRGLDLGRDADLHHLGHFKNFADEALGEAEIEGPRSFFERTPLNETRRGPRIGEHTNEILETICHFSKDEIAKLVDAGVLA